MADHELSTFGTHSTKVNAANIRPRQSQFILLAKALKAPRPKLIAARSHNNVSMFILSSTFRYWWCWRVWWRHCGFDYFAAMPFFCHRSSTANQLIGISGPNILRPVIALKIILYSATVKLVPSACTIRISCTSPWSLCIGIIANGFTVHIAI